MFPGDPAPGCQPVLELYKGAACNLTQLSLGSHSATHMDAPSHFLPGEEPSTRWSLPGAWVPAGCRGRGAFKRRMGPGSGDGHRREAGVVQGRWTISRRRRRSGPRGTAASWRRGHDRGAYERPGPVHRALLEGRGGHFGKLRAGARCRRANISWWRSPSSAAGWTAPRLGLC